jgi:hypothetical protein
MRTLLYLVVFALTLNCSADKAYEQVQSSNSVTNSSSRLGSKAFVGAIPIGFVDGISKKISFKQNQEIVLANFNSLLKKRSNIDAQLKHLSLDETNGTYYLRGYGDTYKSTMLLERSADGNLYTMSVTCTTSACSQTHGCEVTRNGTCSPCSGDCSKSTTSD